MLKAVLFRRERPEEGGKVEAVIAVFCMNISGPLLLLLASLHRRIVFMRGGQETKC